MPPPGQLKSDADRRMTSTSANSTAASKTSTGSSDGDVCWNPPHDLLASSQMTKFAKYIQKKRSPSLRVVKAIRSGEQEITVAHYRNLHKYSVELPHLFWHDVAEYVGLIQSFPAAGFLLRRGAPESEVLYRYRADESIGGAPEELKRDAIPKMDEFPHWFPGMLLNFAENVLRHGAPDSPTRDMPAVYAATEKINVHCAYTFAQLRLRVEAAADALRGAGVGPGDVVASYMPTCPEALVSLLASAAVGATWCSTSPDFGVSGVLDRFLQVKPKVVVSVNAVLYNGKVHPHLSKLRDVAEKLRADPAAGKNLRLVLVHKFMPSEDCEIADIPLAQSYESFIESGRKSSDSTSVPKFKYSQLSFGHPLYVVFSSGTTGKPKGIVHSAGGTLLQHLKEHVIHGNLGVGDVLLQYTTTGWMMWNWMITALAAGCAIVTYDGSPLRPNADSLLSVLAGAKVTVFGTSAKYIQSLNESHARGLARSPSEFDITFLHSIYSTGSPLSPASYDFVYKHFKRSVMLGSITGGTDILSLFIGHNTNLPVRRGRLQCVCLGMDVQAADEDGKPCAPGVAGELVCRQLFPAMPVGFWNDDAATHQLYKRAYFEKFAHVWAHGDFVALYRDAKGNDLGSEMLGRSDGTLNPGGVRFGSAELYNIIAESFSVEIGDSLAVGQKITHGPSAASAAVSSGNAATGSSSALVGGAASAKSGGADDERVCLFLLMNQGHQLGEDLKQRVRDRIRQQLSTRHVPAVLMEVADIPYTVNGKKVEVAVKRILSGETVVASGTLRNPECLRLYEDIAHRLMAGEISVTTPKI